MSTSHLVNANLHRAKEGARVLEDIARFILRDDSLFQEVREIRHAIKIHAPIYIVDDDIGGVGLIEDNLRSSLVDTVQANALRLQEALRVLEEMATASFEKSHFKALRYLAYAIHSKLYFSALKYSHRERLKGLYLIIDTDVISQSLDEIISIINQSPVTIVQYRNKSSSKQQVYGGAKKVREHLNKDKRLIINDHIDIALELGDGVHVGQADYPLPSIRKIMPESFILGISCHNLDEVRHAQTCGATYIAIGCLFATKSKSNTTPVTLEMLKQVCDAVDVPVCGIGGITTANLAQVVSANVAMAALISYVWRVENPLREINAMHASIVMKNPGTLLPNMMTTC